MARKTIHALTRTTSRWFALESISLKMRLGLIFTGLMLLAISFAGAMMLLQHRTAIRGADLTVKEQMELERALSLKETLQRLDRFARQSEVSTSSINRFRKHLEQLRAVETAGAGEEILQTVHEQFERYVVALSQPGPSGEPLAGRERAEAGFFPYYEEVSAAVESFIDLKQETLYRLAHEMKEKQEESIQITTLFLVGFLLLLVLAAFKSISIVTRPLTVLADFLNDVSPETGIPASAPALGWKLPEITNVARSFEKLLQRLRGYQQLNVSRLLLETRRADIIAASISDGIFLLRNDEIVYANPVGEGILNLPQNRNWKGLSLSDVESIHKADSDSEKSWKKPALAIRRALSSTIPVEMEVRAEQRKFHYLLQAYPIPQEVIEQVEHSFDAPVDQLLDQWQANVLVLARDVTLVKESQEAKSHFIATLSHEVKTPVTSLTMATRLLSRGIDQIPNKTHRALIETCTEDVNRLRALIDDLLSVSRFDSLTQKLDRKKVDISKLLKQSVQAFQPQAFERGVEVSLDVAGGRRPIPVSMDAPKVSWALSNLLLNALRHTPRGGKVETVVSVHDGTTEGETGKFVEIRVRDCGPGIQKNRQDRIFDKFNPFYDIRVGRTGNVGMGLAIAREIIVAHGGRIWVVSEPGKGAEFCFSLPLNDPADAREGASGVAGSAVQSEPEDRENDSQKDLKGDYRGASARS